MFRKLKEWFMKESVLAALDLNKKNEGESGCIGLYSRRGIIYGI